MNWWIYVVGILGLALLMVVHEAGHLIAARAFGMRVIKFSIGFGPALWRHQPKGSDTLYQVALIPFLAYVQIAGMNPLEEIDPEDKGSYANASLIGRISAIFAGPLANYLFASVFFFAAFMIRGEPVPTTRIELLPEGVAKSAHMKDGDKIVAISGTRIDTWDQMREKILASPNKPLEFVVERGGKQQTLKITPAAKGEGGGGQIGVRPIADLIPMSAQAAAVRSVVEPAKVVELLVVSLARIITGKDKPQLSGPVGIVREVSRAAQRSWADYLYLLGLLSAYLGGFNLVPFPALDGGRLMFLGYEAVTRRRPNAKVEAQVHMVGLVMLLALILVVTVFDIRGN
ncbi:MAG TPA: M50 family metallopeptidase [Polyangiaceae bacterium]